MKFHYKDKEAARNVLLARIARAEQRVVNAKATLVMAKQHLEVTPDSWRYAFQRSGPYSKAERAAYDAQKWLGSAKTDERKAKKNLEVFDTMIGWEVVVLEGEE